MRYLLGDVSEPERKRIEESIADAPAREAMTAAENDLIDSYVCGELSEKQRWQFEQHFLNSAEKREQLDVARLLMDPVLRQQIATAPVQEQERSTPWWGRAALFLTGASPAMRLAFVSSAVVVAAVVAFLAVENWRLRTELAAMRAEQTELQLQMNGLRQEIASLKTAAIPGDGGQTQGGQNLSQLSTVAILLTAGLPRQAGPETGNDLAVPPTASSVELMLDLPRDRFPQYDVAVETVEGKTIRRFTNLKGQTHRNGRIVAVQFPAGLLPKGDYIVTLSGHRAKGKPQAVDSYSFSVIR